MSLFGNGIEYDNVLHNMNIIVTGGSGFIGLHLIDELTQRRHRVLSVDICEPHTRVQGVTYVIGDICNHDELTKLFSSSSPEIVCHLAALPSIQQSIREPYISLRTNVEGTFSVIEAARVARARRIVFASSAAVYGGSTETMKGKPISEDVPLRPLNLYALAKKMGEEFTTMAAQEKLGNAIDSVSLRFFNVYGARKRRDLPYRTCIETFMEAWKTGKPFPIVPDGMQKRDFIFVKDVTHALALALEHKDSLNGQVINIGYGKSYTVLEVASIIGAGQHEKVFIDPRPGEVKESIADVVKAKKILGWSAAISFEKGIEELKKI